MNGVYEWGGLVWLGWVLYEWGGWFGERWLGWVLGEQVGLGRQWVGGWVDGVGELVEQG